MEMTHPTRLCALCGEKPVAHRFRPFCSKGCADRDLNRWLSDGYRIETDEPADPEADQH